MEPSQGYFADRKIQLVTALKLPNHTAMRLPMVPRISPVCFPSEIERIAHNWYQPEYEIDSNVGDHLQKNERRNPQSKDAIADGKLRVREMNGSKPNMHTQVMREDLRTFAKSSNDADLLALLKKWDELNPSEAAR